MNKPLLMAVASLALLSGYGSGSHAIAAPAPVAAATPGAAPAPNLATGERVYKSTCSICHKSGLRGAPRMGFKQDWTERLAQDKEVLYEHAVKGFTGKKGHMPSRGSNVKLSVEEVKAAVDYMIEYAVPTFTMEK